jgi:hypothetical protein
LHEDTCIVGPNFVLLEDYNRTVNVSAYSPEMEPLRDIPVATAATVWTDPQTGQPHLLIFHECLYFGPRLKFSLICPNQLCANGVLVNDVPRQFDPKSIHSIVADGIVILLELDGAISFFETRLPTPAEIELLPLVQMTSAADWPDTLSAMPFHEPSASINISYAKTTHHLVDRSVNELDDERDTYDRLIACVHIHPTVSPTSSAIETIYSTPAVNPDGRHASAITSSALITPIVLSKRWGISLETAQRTLNASTQTAVRNGHTPSERTIRKKAPWLQFPTLTGDIYVDSMFSKVDKILSQWTLVTNDRPQ